MRAHFRHTGWLVLLMTVTGVADAQLSPGKLHQAHEDLEGLTNCTKCHDLGKKIQPEKCLDCHTLLRDRIASGQGLHAGTDYADCFDCHVEHNGRDYELIWWPDGRDDFDHTQVSFSLEGRHATLGCDRCHNSRLIADRKTLLERGKDLDRTHLGLNATCVACHADVHRGQLAPECTSCHTLEGWKPPSGFDHARTRFALTGRHVEISCAKCHPTVAVGSPDDPTRDIAMAASLPGAPPSDSGSVMRFRLDRFQACADCHEDVHRGRFAETCESCHRTTGWHDLAQRDFDHDRTRYPLRGRHVTVECSRCHLPQRERTAIAFQSCTDCHADYHQGQFTTRADGGACEACHTVDGFSPSTFTLTAHQSCGYPLEGAHLAIPCVACHQGGATGTSDATPRFRFASTRCADCHRDPHQGQVSTWTERGGCEHCHRVDSWRRIDFDHDTTRFRLLGRHTTASCGVCHASGTNGDRRYRFRETSTGCEGCHEDAHAGQFTSGQASNGGSGNTGDACERCHTSDSWRADRFDHNRDARFRLDGKHARVACRGCHPMAQSGEKTYVWFRPIDSTCEACHDPSYRGKTL